MEERAPVIEVPKSAYLVKTDFADAIALSPVLASYDSTRASLEKPPEKNATWLGSLLQADRMIRTSPERDRVDSQIASCNSHLVAVSRRYANTIAKMIYDEYTYAKTNFGSVDLRNLEDMGRIVSSYQESIFQPLGRGETPQYRSFAETIRSYENTTVARKVPEGELLSDDPWVKHTVLLERMSSVFDKMASGEPGASNQMLSCLNEFNNMYHAHGQSISLAVRMNPEPGIVWDLDRLFVEKELDAYGLSRHEALSLVQAQSSPFVRENILRCFFPNSTALDPAEIRNTDRYRRAVVKELRVRAHETTSIEPEKFVSKFIAPLLNAYAKDDPIQGMIRNEFNNYSEWFEEAF